MTDGTAVGGEISKQAIYAELRIKFKRRY